MGDVSTCEAKARAWVADYAKPVLFPRAPFHGSVTSAVVEQVTMKSTIVAAIAAIYGEAEPSHVSVRVRGLPPRVAAVLLTPVLGGVGGPARDLVRTMAIQSVGASVISYFEGRYPGKLCATDTEPGTSSSPQPGE